MNIWVMVAVVIFAIVFGVAILLIGRKNADKVNTLNTGVNKAKVSVWAWIKRKLSA